MSASVALSPSFTTVAATVALVPEASTRAGLPTRGAPVSISASSKTA